MKGIGLYVLEERAAIRQTFPRAEIFHLLRATADMYTQTATFSKVNEQILTWGEDAKESIMNLRD